MVDGHRTAIDILANTSSIGETSDFFRQLIDEGFVRELGAPAVPVPRPAPVAGTGGATPGSLADLKRYVILILRDVVGNRDAAAFRILIDTALTPEEIGDIIPLHRDVPWTANNRHRSDDYMVLGRRLGQETEAAVLRG